MEKEKLELINKVFLKRKDAIYVEQKENEVENEYKKALIATASKNLESLGYQMSPKLAESLLHVSLQEIVDTAEVLKDSLLERLGGNVEYNPMYPGFPESVMERSEAELYFDAVIYAFSGFEVLPEDEERTRTVVDDLGDTKEFKIIDLADINTAKDITSNLMSSQIAFSQDDKQDLVSIHKAFAEEYLSIPEKIPNRENLAWLAATYMEENHKGYNPFLGKMRSATDILRTIAIRNGGDASLTENIKFKTLPRREVRVYANKMFCMPDIETEMYKKQSLFKKLNESYHLRSIKAYNQNIINEKLDKLYDKTLERSFFSKRDAAIKEGNFTNLVRLYYDQPGQMGPDIVRLSLLAQEQKNYYVAKATLCTAFRANTEKMSTLNLLKMKSVLESKKEQQKYNVYSPKKGLSNPYMKLNTQAPLRGDLIRDLDKIIEYRLEERYEKKRPLGKVYVEKELEDIKIPSQQRANSQGSVGMSFGSQFPVDKKIDYLRSFIWWTNSEKSDFVDIDLSADLYDKDLQKITDVSYYNLKGDGLGTHSGDIRDGGPVGGKGAAEFIDIDLNKLKNYEHYGKKPAYVMFSVRVFSGENFADTPCKFGWMQSDHQPAKLFDITKVERAIELNTNSTRSIPVLFDIENQKMIWMDRNPREMSDIKLDLGNNNITYASCDAVEAYRALHTTTPDLHSLIMAHVNARGELVDDPKEADTIFSVERLNKEDYPNAKELICSYDNDMIVGDLISDELSQQDRMFFAKEEQEHETEIIQPDEDDFSL